MSKIQTVLRYEFLNVLRSRSFLITLFLLPLMGLAAVLIISALQKNNQGQSIFSFLSPPAKIETLGLIDHSGIIKVIPAGAGELIVRYADEAGALEAVSKAELAGYYVVAADYLTTGQVDLYKSEINVTGQSNDTYLIQGLLEENLMTDNRQLLNLFRQPINLETQYLTSEPQRDPNSALTYFLPYAVTMLFYMLILGTSSTMLNSVTNEKQNRVMEILLTSITPTQMLTGKIIALGLIGLLQTTFWFGSAFLLYRLSGQAFALPLEFALPVSILAWGILFFLLGYAIYASLMAGVGAMVPNLRESSQATFLVIFPLIIPLFFINTLIGQPNGPFSMALSFFPLTAPVAMLSRLAGAQIPWWQPTLSAVLCAGTAMLIVRAVAGMFRAQNLLSGQTFKARIFLKALIGKA
jgi:ABC-2 type transport system permease protein